MRIEANFVARLGIQEGHRWKPSQAMISCGGLPASALDSTRATRTPTTLAYCRRVSTLNSGCCLLILRAGLISSRLCLGAWTNGTAAICGLVPVVGMTHENHISITSAGAMLSYGTRAFPARRQKQADSRMMKKMR
jgi:hypothetical protein